MKHTTSLLFALGILVNTFAQCMLYEVSMEDRFNNSAMVIEGSVIDQYAIKKNNYIYTIHEIKISAVFKGNPEGSVVKVVTLGGAVENEMVVAHPSLELRPEERGVYFIDSKELENNSYFVYSGPQGLIRYDLEKDKAYDPFNDYGGIYSSFYPQILSLTESNQYRVIEKIGLNKPTNNKAAGSITDFSPKNLTAGTKSVLTITGSNFGISRGSGRVEFANASSGPNTVNPSSAQYISWTDTEIKVEVPSAAGTGRIRVLKNGTSTSSEDLVIEYAQLNVNTTNGFAYPVAHVNDNQKGGYDWRMHTSFDANSNAKSTFERAFENWIDATCVNWNLLTPTAIDATQNDGNNVIRFGASGEVSTGVLAVTSSYYGSCGAATVWYLQEVDMTYNVDITWNFDQGSPKPFEYDLESVTIHELGHAHQLGHVNDEVDIMHRSIGPGKRNRSIKESNRRAGNFVQAQSVSKNSCGPSEMINFPGCTSILSVMENADKEVYTTYPNPLNDELWIEFNSISDIPMNYEITDMSGKLVSEGTCHGLVNRVDVSEINSGLYLLTIRSKGYSETSRIVIQ